MALIKVDFHFHTCYSIDSQTAIENLPGLIKKSGLDKLAITDHNTISGALAARQIMPDKIIVGEEVKTTKGELLVYYIEKLVPAGLTPEETIQLAREQGAVISVPHPFDIRRGGWHLQDLIKIVPMIDAIEVFNSRTLQRKYNEKAKAFAEAHQLPVTAGSDGHTARELGRAYLVLPEFEDAEGLRYGLKTGTSTGRSSGIDVLFSSTYARILKRVKLRHSAC